MSEDELDELARAADDGDSAAASSLVIEADRLHIGCGSYPTWEQVAGAIKQKRTQENK